MRKAASGSSSKVRLAAARAIWAVCALFAVVLAAGALLIALESTNRDNGLVAFVLDFADAVDLSVFDRRNGVLDFQSETKDALFNWGLAAIVWLVAGRILERIVRP